VGVQGIELGHPRTRRGEVFKQREGSQARYPDMYVVYMLPDMAE
jgi:hypothetical protein